MATPSVMSVGVLAAWPRTSPAQLGHGPRVEDPLGQHGAQGDDGGTVVAVFGVVVVFDDQASGGGPPHQRASSFSAQHHAHRELVRRGEQDGRRVAQRVHLQAFGVDRDGQ